MSLATLYGIGSTLIPGPKLFVAKDEKGVWTGRLTFTCQKFKLMLAANQLLLAKGTPITSLYSDAEDYSFLQVRDWDSEDQPGGLSEVTVNFVGTNYIGDDDGSFDNEDSVSYSRSDSYKDESIWNNPKLIADLTSAQRELLKQTVAGEVRLVGGSFLYWSNDGYAGSYSESMAEWYESIVVQNQLTYRQPVSEWTKTSTGRGFLPSAIAERMGTRETPDGNPEPPKDQVWILSGATENIPVLGTGVNSYSLTWTSGNFNNIAYDP